MSKLKTACKNWRVIILALFLVAMAVSLQPNPWASGVVINAVVKDSAAARAGFESPKQGLQPMSKEVILELNGKTIETEQDYYAFTNNLRPNQSIQVKTTKTTRYLTTTEAFKTTTLNETELKTIEETVLQNETLANGTTITTNIIINTTKEVPKTLTQSLGLADIGFKITAAPTSNIRKGLDLQGGTRVLLKPVEQVSTEDFASIVDSMKERLNVYGLSDVLVTEVSQPALFGTQEKFILVEIAGATEEEVKDLLARQGKFEATIANKTVFKGGNDIPYVCRTAQCSGIDPQQGCSRQTDDSWACAFQFSISLTPEAAQRQADATRTLPIQGTGSQAYLSQPLVLYLDDQQVDSLNIAADLKGRAVKEISISGSGSGTSQQAAQQDALNNMKRLQTVLITGSLPVKVEAVKTDTISPQLGAQFLTNAFYTAIVAMIAVSLILFLVYRKIGIAIPIIGTMLAEIFSILGLAALTGQNMDLAAIAGIIAAVGTGVNDQVVILDESLGKKNKEYTNWGATFKRAFFIIFSAFATVVVAMIPLLFAGAGLLKGFAITTILGLCVGVLITRPAYAAFIRIMFEE